MSSFAKLSAAARKYLPSFRQLEPPKIEDSPLNKTRIISNHYIEGRPDIELSSDVTENFGEMRFKDESLLDISMLAAQERSIFCPVQSESYEVNFSINNFDEVGPLGTSAQLDISEFESPVPKRQKFQIDTENIFDCTDPSNSAETLFQSLEEFVDPVKILTEADQSFMEDSFNVKTRSASESFVYCAPRPRAMSTSFSEFPFLVPKTVHEAETSVKFNSDMESKSEISSENAAFNILEESRCQSSLFDVPPTSDSELKQTIIDETIVPERCKSKFFEKSYRQKEVFFINTYYCEPKRIQPKKEIKFESFPDEIADALLLMEPSLDYLEERIAPRKVELGEMNQEVLDDSFNYEDIQDSLEEIKKSFNEPEAGFSTSTPNESRQKKESTQSQKKENRSIKITSQEFESQKLESQAVKSQENNRRRLNYQNVQSTSQNSPTEILSQQSQKNAFTQKSMNLSQKSPKFDDFIASLKSQSEGKKFKFQESSQHENILSQQKNPSKKSDDKNNSKKASPSFVFSLSQYLDLTSQPLESSEVKQITKNSDKHENSIMVMAQENPMLYNTRRQAILKQIESIFIGLLKSLKDGKPLLLKIQTIKSWDDCKMTNNILSQNEKCLTTKTLSFGNKTTSASFTCLTVIMCEIYKMLSRNTMCTKRELYYRDVDLFKRQNRVDDALKKLCSLLDVQEFELGVLSSSKGLIAGDLTIHVGDEVICCTATRNVPTNPSAITSFESKADFVLVVEKDTVFQRLINDSNFKKVADKIVLVTAKGYPDVNTRILLKKVSTMTQLPIYIIVDADPHGIEIMCTYKFGSIMKVQDAEYLAVPSIQWIGIHPTDIETLNAAKIDLTEADLKKVDELLQRPYINPQLQRELNCLKQKRHKAEIESIYHFSTDYLINDYIPQKIRLIDPPPLPGVDF